VRRSRPAISAGSSLSHRLSHSVFVNVEFAAKEPHKLGHLIERQIGDEVDAHRGARLALERTRQRTADAMRHVEPREHVGYAQRGGDGIGDPQFSWTRGSQPKIPTMVSTGSLSAPRRNRGSSSAASG
jgi:hypothetical protein